MLFAAAVLAAGVAVGVVSRVIPPVRDIWVPHTNGSGGSVPAFWASVVANLTFSVVLVVTAVFDFMGRKAVRWTVAILAVGALAQALMYLDAESAFHGGPLEGQMHSAITWLRYLEFADASAGLLALVAAAIAVRGNRTV